MQLYVEVERQRAPERMVARPLIRRGVCMCMCMCTCTCTCTCMIVIVEAFQVCSSESQLPSDIEERAGQAFGLHSAEVPLSLCAALRFSACTALKQPVHYVHLYPSTTAAAAAAAVSEHQRDR